MPMVQTRAYQQGAQAEMENCNSEELLGTNLSIFNQNLIFMLVQSS